MATVTSLANIAALKAFTSISTDTVVVEGVLASGDGGGGTFVVNPGDTTSAGNDGTIIVDGASPQRRWYRLWDGKNAQAEWWGIFPGTATNSSFLSKVPQYVALWFLPGTYTFTAYPTASAFGNRLYRSHHHCRWNCTSSVTGVTAFPWYWDGAVTDLELMGLSPLEGIVIVGPGTTTNVVGLSIDTSPGGNGYYVRPRNFGISGFNVNLQLGVAGGGGSPANVFMYSLENVVLFGGGINLKCDLRGSSNSGENMRLKNCVLSNATGAGGAGLQIWGPATWYLEGCSFDYNQAVFGLYGDPGYRRYERPYGCARYRAD